MLMNNTLLTGVKPTGTPHLGNYLGAIKPAIDQAHTYEHSFVFIADYHALNTVQNGEQLRYLTRSIAATWLALGLDPARTIFYKQSAISEDFELATILNAFTPKGWMNKAHAYKAAVDQNTDAGKDRDEGVNMGLYTYPILMAADILLFNTTVVPVGKDQVQHIEIARDIAQKFNHVYGQEILTLPSAKVVEELEAVPGVDGRKMSKSYDNIIPIFASSNEWKKAINKIPTDSSAVDAPKSTEGSTLFAIYSAVATPEDTQAAKAALEAGRMGWGELKQHLLTTFETLFSEATVRYNSLMENPDEIDRILRDGAVRAREVAHETLKNVRGAAGTN